MPDDALALMDVACWISCVANESITVGNFIARCDKALRDRETPSGARFSNDFSEVLLDLMVHAKSTYTGEFLTVLITALGEAYGD